MKKKIIGVKLSLSNSMVPTCSAQAKMFKEPSVNKIYVEKVKFTNLDLLMITEVL